MRIAITGGPRTGKTTLARRLTIEAGRDPKDPLVLMSTDDLLGQLEWSEISSQVAYWFDAPGPWIVEGVAVSRALRKWRVRHPDAAPPVDRVIFLDEPRDNRSKGQIAMAKGVATVHGELAEWLRMHGVETEYPR